MKREDVFTASKQSLISFIVSDLLLPRSLVSKMKTVELRAVVSNYFDTIAKTSSPASKRPVHEFETPRINFDGLSIKEFENVKLAIDDSVLYIAVSLVESHRTLNKDGEAVWTNSGKNANPGKPQNARLTASWKYHILKTALMQYNVKLDVTAKYI